MHTHICRNTQADIYYITLLKADNKHKINSLIAEICIRLKKRDQNKGPKNKGPKIENKCLIPCTEEDSEKNLITSKDWNS